MARAPALRRPVQAHADAHAGPHADADADAHAPAHRARALRPLALAAALATLPALPAHAEDRYWTFIGGCSTADWLGTTGGVNAQNRVTCWSVGAFGGISGFPTPTAADDVFVYAPAATSTLLVTVASPLRPPFTAAARDVYVQGSTSFAAGLSIDRYTAAFRNLLVGSEGSPSLIGRVDQSAGSVTIGNSLVLRSGDYNLSGGSLNAGGVTVRSQTGAARYTQTGGTLITNAVDLRSEFGRDASFAALAGTVSGNALTVGSSAVSAGSSAVRVSNFGTVWNTTGATIVGAFGAGTLDIDTSGRALTGSAVVGDGIGASGTVNVADLGSSWSVNGKLTVGNAGNGVLNVGSGGHVSAATTLLNGQVGNTATATVTGTRSQLDSGLIVVGRTRDAAIDVAAGGAVVADAGVVGEGAGGTARVIGAGSRWTNASSLVVGQDGKGRLEVIDHAQLQSTAASVGANPGGVGSVLVTGGAHWQATDNAGTGGTLVVGEGGNGSVTLAGGATLTTVSTTVGGAVSSFGSVWRGLGQVTLDGATTLWTTDKLMVGDRGNGSFSAGGGSRLAVRSVNVGFAVDGQGQLAASGAGTRIEIAQDLTVGVASVGGVSVSGGAALTTGATVLGDVGSGTGSVAVDGAGSSWTSSQPITVGSAGRGVFAVTAGATAAVGGMTLGRTATPTQTGTGTVSVSDPGSQLTVTGTLRVGGGGVGTLTVANQGLVVTNGLTTAGTSGRVVLDGGTLRSVSLALGDPARLDWRSGVLQVTGNQGLALDGSQLPTVLQLLPGRTLQVDRTLTIDSSSALLLSGGQLRAGALTLNHGLLASTGGGAYALDMDLVPTLTGQGQVAARVTGGLGQNQIFASGPLTLGVLERADGYAFNGLLAVGANQVLLLDRDLADLGSATYLVGGQLATVNGARLAAGQLLTSSASSSVQGRFVNGGQVASDAGVLSFFDRVGGSGGFSGNLLFLAGYDPGDTAGSIARAHFGKGGVTFDRYATLTLDVADASGYDRLLDIGALRFDGVLALHFGAGFAAAPGTVLSLLDFTSFSGSLNADRVTVDGYDRALLDFSRLAIDGTVTVTAVPEPGALALALAGLGVVALRLRRAG